MKTLAAILEEIDRPLALREVEIPTLAAGQVLVDVQHSSLCHSQINELRGRRGPDRFLPHTLGHEGSGVVLEVGPGVTKVKAGDPVVLTWLRGDGADAKGALYRDGARVINSGPVSTFLRQAVVSESRIVRVGSDWGVAPALLPLLGCALPTGFGAIEHGLKPTAGSSLAIWGVGGIGLAALLAARAAGCTPLVAIDIRPEKLELARALGATHVIDGAGDPVAELLALTGGRGVDYALECAGAVAVIERAFAGIRKGGGRLLVAGNPPRGERLALDPLDLIAGKNIAGTWGGEVQPDRDLPRFVETIRAQALPIERLVTHHGPLEEINSLLSLLETGRAGRIVLDHA